MGRARLPPTSFMPAPADGAAMRGTAFQYGGVTVAWDPDAGLLEMRHGPDPVLSDHVAWTLGRQMGAWIRGREGQVGVLVDGGGLGALPDDWRDYWIKVLRLGFVKGFAVLGASRAFARTARDVAKLTRVPFRCCDAPEEARAFLAGLPARPWRAAPPGQPLPAAAR